MHCDFEMTLSCTMLGKSLHSWTECVFLYPELSIHIPYTVSVGFNESGFSEFPGLANDLLSPNFPHANSH